MNEVTTKKYTDKQERFLAALFSEEALGDVRTAMTLAGYDKTSNTHDVVNSLKEEIVDRTNLYLATVGPNAAMALFQVMIEPSALGSSVKLNAAKEILDRIGVVKKEEKGDINIRIDNVVELPEKKPMKIIEAELSEQ